MLLGAKLTNLPKTHSYFFIHINIQSNLIQILCVSLHSFFVVYYFLLLCIFSSSIWLFGELETKEKVRGRVYTKYANNTRYKT